MYVIKDANGRHILVNPVMIKAVMADEVWDGVSDEDVPILEITYNDNSTQRIVMDTFSDARRALAGIGSNFKELGFSSD